MYAREPMSRITVLACVLLLALPAAALAQNNPFSPIPPAPPQQTAPPQDDSDDGTALGEDEGLSRRQQLLIGLAGAVLLGGIAIAILRDARRSAPVEHHRREDEGGTRSRGTRTPKERRVSQGRARAKAARRARRKNR